MIKCLATGCALILDVYNPSKYYWGDMHIVNGAYVFAAAGPLGSPIANDVEQLSGQKPIFHVARHQNFLTRGSIYILEDGTPNEAFLERSRHYLRQVYGVAFSAQDRVIAPFYTEQAAIDASRDWGADGVITLDSPLIFEKELATIRHQHLEATKDWGRHPDVPLSGRLISSGPNAGRVRSSPTGRASKSEPEIQQLPGFEARQLDSLSAVLAVAIGAIGGGTALAAATTPPWEPERPQDPPATGDGGNFSGGGATGEY